jgi:hypothetical protein
MVNTSTSYPPIEGRITQNPDTGAPFNVTIPFLGVRGVLSNAASDGSKLVAADGGTATLTNTTIANPNFKGLADFTSGGGRNGDDALKPEITAPGVSIVSVGIGTGNGAATLSGTSMAAPHTSGVAALVRQAHPDWARVSDLKAAMVNTADPAGVSNYTTRIAGAGLVQAPGATRTDVDAVGPKQSASLSYGFQDIKSDYSHTLTMTLNNHGGSAATFSLADSNASGASHSISFSANPVTVPAGGSASVDVTLNVPVATVGNEDALRDVAGLVKLTPTSGNNGVTLRLPYYFVPRADSNLGARLGARTVSAGSPSTTATLTNPGGAIATNADYYAWGLSDPSDTNASNDVRAIGTQSFPFPSSSNPTRRLLVFAVNGYNKWSTAATNEFDIYVDVNGDGEDDYIVVGVDQGAVQTGSFNGAVGSFVFSTHSPGASINFLAAAPTDGSTEEIAVLTSQLCRSGEPCLSSASNPRITYHAFGFDLLSDSVDVVNGTAKYNVWSSSISQGDFISVAPGATQTSTVTINPAEWAQTPALGQMIVGLDNKAGKDEAQLLDLALR